MGVFSERLKQLRLERGENQSDVAAILRVSVQSYSAYEAIREPKYDSLIKLARHFDVTTDYLLGFSEVRKPENQLLHSDIGLSDKSIEVLRAWKDTPIIYMGSSNANLLLSDWKDILDIVISSRFFGIFIKFLALRADPKIDQIPDVEVSINEYEKLPAKMIYDSMIKTTTDDLVRAIKDARQWLESK